MTKRLLPALLLTIALLSGVAGAQTFQPTPRPHQNFVDSAGNACNGCSLFSYLAGSTTPTPTYTDSTGGTQNPNPIILDAAGGANIWLSSSITYKFVLIEGGVTQWTVDQVPGSGGVGNFCLLTGCTFSGPITAPGFLGPLTGTASGNLPLTGGQLAGPGILNIGSTINFYITTLAQLNSAISACGSLPNCGFWIGATVTINSSTTFPSGASIVFVGGAFNGSGAISMPHASIGAASTQVVFTGANAITGLDIADPGWWGGRTSGAEFANAIGSLTNASGGTIILGLGTYATPGAVTTPNLQIVGSGMPSYNAGYTALVGGSIIQGTIQLEGNYNKIQNLGIDTGSAFQGASCTDGLDIANSLTPGTTAIQRPVVRDVAVLLAAPSCSTHGLLIENTNFANISHVKAVYGFYGLVVKSSNATARDVWVCGNSSSSIYVKADAAFSGNISNILIDGFTVDNSCATAAAGVLAEAQSATITGVTFDHGRVVNNTGNAINIEGDSASFLLTDWNIDHFSSINAGGVGIFMQSNTLRGNIDHAIIDSPFSQGVFSSSASFPLNISNTIVTNSTVGGFFLTSVTNGNVEISNSQVIGSGGSPTPYGITVTAGVVNLVNFNATNNVTAVCIASGGTCNFNSIPVIYSAGSVLTAPIIQVYQVSLTAGTVTQALSGFTATPICNVGLVQGGTAVGTATPTVWVSAVSSTSVTVNAALNTYTNGVAITCYGH